MGLNRVECRRCGFKWNVAASKKNDKDLLCRSCRQGKQKVIQYGDLRCEPHLGKVNDDLDPLDDNGELFMPGVRLCGHRDCVNSKHVSSCD